MGAAAPACPLCTDDGATVIARAPGLRVVLVDDADHPGFARVILDAHVAELGDLPAAGRIALIEAVVAVERAQREVLAPVKVNLASLGNVVPHLHWHVIPRHADDAQFPDPVWAPRRRVTPEPVLAARRALLPALVERIRAAIAALR